MNNENANICANTQMLSCMDWFYDILVILLMLESISPYSLSLYLK